ncbi:MAG: amino acid adenylation domain-containing protein [Candidatus Binatia bacterium]
MTTAEFITYLHSLDAKLWADGDHLRCSAPKTVLTPALQAELRDRKAEILGFLQATGAATRVAPPPLQPVSRDENPPLSFAQQRLWFVDQLEPGSAVYNIPRAFRVTGPLYVAALEQSFNEMIQRHEVLRTTFSVAAGQPAQVIAPTLTLTLPVVDLRGLPEQSHAAEISRLAAQEVQRPFDLSRGPLLRATLLQVSGEDHVLLLVLHHIISDGWSMSVLCRELTVLYAALLEEKPSPLPELPIQYADFSVWQREWLQGETLEAELSYWRKQLNGIPQLLELPTDRPRRSTQTYRGARQSILVSKEVCAALKSLCEREGVTLFMTLLAAFKALLYRYTGQHDIVAGTPIAGRNRMELEGLIGFFVNTLVLRTDLSGNPTFTALLRRVRGVALGAYEHENLPFEKLVEELQPERDLSRSPLFQVLFQLRNFHKEPLNLVGLSVEDSEFDTGIARFDIALDIIEKSEGLSCLFRYNVDLFDQSTISRMGDHFSTLLEGIAADPEQRISDLAILTPAEKRQLLAEWNDTKRDYPRDRCIHELFEEQVARSPETLAIVFENQQLTYQELNRRANQLAHYLRTLGVGPEALVGICMERSLEMIIALLGILKTGGAYVPLDPTYPQARLAFILEDTQAPVLLTQSKLIEQLPERTADRKLATGRDGPETEDGRAIKTQSSLGPSAIRNSQSAIRNPTVVCLDTDCEKIARESEENPVNQARAENLAYVIYTSGSTGIPKGVLIEHKQILNYVQAFRDRCEFENGASLALVQPLSVDASQSVIFPSLVSGGCLHILSEDSALDAHRIGEYFRRRSIDLLKIAPSHLAALLASGKPEYILPRKRLVVGGEACNWSLIETVHTLAPDCVVLNHYGPTETTVGVIAHQVEKDQGIRSATVPLGRPMANTQIYILDSDFQTVPVGVSSEIYVGGAGLARGYLNRVELTAEKFIPDPFSGRPGARLYQTGDLARYLPDGNIEFLGRNDHQVKIRGFRIELGEIEAVLQQHPSIRQAMVLSREDASGDKRLVAYLVPDQDAPPSTRELDRFLKEKLPHYMAPSTFVLMRALPKTPHGKLDRGALPVPDQNGLKLEENFVAPRTHVEESLAGIWADVLKLRRIGIHDNFFHLGGHSLSAIQVISRVRETFGVEIFLRALFEKPTLARFAEMIVEAKNRRGQHSTPDISTISPLPRRLQRLKFS